MPQKGYVNLLTVTLRKFQLLASILFTCVWNGELPGGELFSNNTLNVENYNVKGGVDATGGNHCKKSRGSVLESVTTGVPTFGVFFFSMHTSLSSLYSHIHTYLKN